MNVHQKGRAWVLDWRENGARKRHHFETEREARQAQRTTEARLEQKRPRPPRTPLQQLATQFTATKASNAPSRFTTIKNVTARLAESAGQTKPGQLTAAHLTQFRLNLRRYKNNTRALHEQIARGFLRWCYRTGHVHTPAEELLPPSRLRTEQRTQTTDPETTADITAAAAQIQATADHHPRNNTKELAQLVATLGTEAGMRIAEITRAQVQDWNTHTRTLTVRSAKNHPNRTIPANPKLTAYLDNTTSGKKPTEKLTQQFSPTNTPVTTRSLQKHWNAAARAARHPEIRPHDLRRTWATQLAEHAPLPVLMELAGWENPRTALFYLMGRGEKAKRAAIDRAWKARQEAETQAQADTPESTIDKGPTIQ